MHLDRARPRVAQAMVEFVLGLPLLLALSLGASQLVLYAHAGDVVTSAAQEGARIAAEDGRSDEEGYARAQVLVTAGLGSSVGPTQVTIGGDDQVVRIQIDTVLHPVVPLPVSVGLPLHAQAWVARERFRPGGS
jgi:hypothetical protein